MSTEIEWAGDIAGQFLSQRDAVAIKWVTPKPPSTLPLTNTEIKKESKLMIQVVKQNT